MSLNYLSGKYHLLCALAFCLSGWTFATEPLPNGVIMYKDIEFAQLGDVSLKLDLYCLEDRPKEPLPLIVWIHGGGFRTGDKEPCPAVDFIRHGFVIASINYRLSDMASFPAQVHDCKAAIRFLRGNADKYGVDPARIGVWGSSAGGHLASLLGTTSKVKALVGVVGSFNDESSDVQAACVSCGPTDFSKRSYTQKRLKHIEKYLGGDLKTNTYTVILANPASWVTPVCPPFLIIHGIEDEIVEYSQSLILYDKLKKCMVDAELVSLEDTGHVISESKDIAQVKNKVVDFFKHNLTPRNNPNPKQD